jgi:hypothetical protein
MAKKRKIDRAKRLAASGICYTLFGVCGAIEHALRQLAYEHPPSGHGCGAGLTKGEREYIMRLSTDFHRKGQIILHLAWRFNGLRRFDGGRY